MKKVLPTLLAVVLVLGVLGAVGFAGYRYGFQQGALSASNGDPQFLTPGYGFGAQRMPMHNFGDGFDRGFDPRGFNMMQNGRGFGFFSPFRLLIPIAFWGLILWAVYSLVMRSGFRLTRQANETQPRPVETEVKETTQTTED